MFLTETSCLYELLAVRGEVEDPVRGGEAELVALLGQHHLVHPQAQRQVDAPLQLWAQH